jgi:small subunit ribosomal protein S3
MGQKVHPIGFRLAVSKDWQSRWYAPQKDYADQLHADLKVRRYLESRLQKGAVSRVIIERAWNSVRVTLHTSRPGLIIGKRGQEIEVMTADISRMCKGSQVKIDIHEIRQPELDSAWVAAQVATQLERRVSFRRAMKRAIQTAMDFGADGIRIRAAGRLGGAEMSRTLDTRLGSIPLSTLQANVEYAVAHSSTNYGVIGVKVWVFKGLYTEHDEDQTHSSAAGGRARARGRR